MFHRHWEKRMTRTSVGKKKTPTRPLTPKTFHPSPADLAAAPTRIKKILPLLFRHYPDARCALDYRTPLELLIATILSAQCTDTRVNQVTPALFRKYPSAADYARAPLSELEQDIKSTGFYRNKAKNIQAACRAIAEKYHGKVPDTLDQLVTLPGVGRKTANVVLGNAYGVPGITCDTHVIRLSRLLGLADQSDPVKLEFALMDLVPKKHWTVFSHMMILHGRQICRARKPDCPRCPLRPHCPYHLTATAAT